MPKTAEIFTKNRKILNKGYGEEDLFLPLFNFDIFKILCYSRVRGRVYNKGRKLLPGILTF